MCPEKENSHFSHTFLEHGYLTYYDICLFETFTLIVEMCLEGSKSQNSGIYSA